MKANYLMAPVLLAMLTGCAVENDVDWEATTTGLVVDLVSVGGLPVPEPGEVLDLPRAGARNGVEVVFDAAVLGAGPELAGPGQDLWVRVSTRPGKLQVLEAAQYAGNDILLAGGEAHGVRVKIWDVFGPVRIWVEDAGFRSRTIADLNRPARCSDGQDNDSDGFIDYPDDSGCLGQTDDSEEAGSGAAGVSEPITFDSPTAAQLQGYFEGGDTSTTVAASPYSGEGVTVSKGNLVVTRVTTDGMYVTDTADDGSGFNHLFVFTYNSPTTRPICETDEYDSTSCINQNDRPIPLRVCDRLTSVGGAVSEFYGFTEVSFPVWNTILWDPNDGDCEVPAPAALNASDFRGNGTVPMEGHEAGLVMLRDVEAATAKNIVDCDFNDDGAVDFRDYDTLECSNECLCREDCLDDPLCVEITQYNEYGQWPVRLGGAAGVKVWISSRESVPEFDPFAADAPEHYSAIVGTLRNLSFLDPFPWIIEPRCVDDLVRTGEPLPSSEACVNPRMGE